MHHHATINKKFVVYVRSCNNLIKSGADMDCCVVECTVHATHFSMSIQGKVVRTSAYLGLVRAAWAI